MLSVKRAELQIRGIGLMSEPNLTPEEYANIIRELRNSLIISANNAHERKKIVNEVKPERMFYNEMHFESLVEFALNKSKEFAPEYESKIPLLWNREGEP